MPAQYEHLIGESEMNEKVPQKRLKPVLHGFLLREPRIVPSSKIKIMKLFGTLSTKKPEA